MHVAAALSHSPSRRGVASRRQSFAARSPKGSAGGCASASPKSTARGPGLVPPAVLLTPRGPAAASGSPLGGPPSPLSRRQSLAGASLTRMAGAAAGAKAGTQGLQQGLLGMAPIPEDWAASQVEQHGLPAILGLPHLLAGISAAGAPYMQSPILRSCSASGLPLCCRAGTLLAMLRPMLWQTSCASRPVPWCQAKMARPARSATRPGVQVASLTACADRCNLKCPSGTSRCACAISINHRGVWATSMQLQAISIGSAGVCPAFLRVHGIRHQHRYARGEPCSFGTGTYFCEAILLSLWLRYLKTAQGATSLAEPLSLQVLGTL